MKLASVGAGRGYFILTGLPGLGQSVSIIYFIAKILQTDRIKSVFIQQQGAEVTHEFTRQVQLLCTYFVRLPRIKQWDKEKNPGRHTHKEGKTTRLLQCHRGLLVGPGTCVLATNRPFIHGLRQALFVSPLVRNFILCSACELH